MNETPTSKGIHGLTFASLRDRNETRADRWHKGSPPPLDFAMMELAGEVGEACNAAKKLARLHRGMAGGENTIGNLADELADVVICADLAAMRAGIDLGEAVVRKFNATSEKHGFPERLTNGIPAPAKFVEVFRQMRRALGRITSIQRDSEIDAIVIPLNSDRLIDARQALAAAKEVTP